MLYKEEIVREVIQREIHTKYYSNEENTNVLEILTKETLLEEIKQLEKNEVVEEMDAYFKAFYKFLRKFPNMTITEHSVLCFLMACERKEGYSYYNEASLAETFNMSQKGISKVIESLHEKNFITKFFCQKNGIQRIIKVNRKFIYCDTNDNYNILRVDRGYDVVLFFEKKLFYDVEFYFEEERIKGLIRIPYRKLEKFLEDKKKIVFNEKFDWGQFLLEASYKKI
jgi:DNA-binding MarR family transcriptional regulator